MVSLTQAAKAKFVEVAESEGRKGHGLRVIVRNGGTHQPEFALNFVAPEERRDDDLVVDAGGIEVYIDPESARWLEGASVDFVDALDESGFKVDAPASGIPRPTGPLAEAVQKVLEDKINPAVAAHGGFISLVAIDEGTAYLRFGGGCQGCGMVNVTLKQGVEKVLFEQVPQLSKVMDVTDHAAGTNPYFQPGK
jgi:Fe/S biogenesis protein NfuA